MSMKGKNSVITGAGSGIGRATAEKMATQGASLLLVDYNEEALNDTVNLIKLKGGEAIGVRADVSNPKEVKHYVNEAKLKLGRIDFFHNNAGVLQKPSLLHETEESEFDRIMEVNVKGAFLGLKYVLAVMVEQHSGVIVNTSSHAGIRAEPGLGVYAATKHALAGMTVTAASEYGSQGIRVNAVCPGGVMTNMTAGMVDRDHTGFCPMQRLASASEIAAVVAFLFSEEATYVNGVLMPVDGGLSV
ncbi:MULTISPECIES: SDR family NAD(P)-dependent oxidoreductase [unclassified Bacillus (in: firmicutes)]|uniref:SDR family NAD(P)-dependent oxidoreductase n=1 Tax=unclassified Bacillus (in: firmicutes) TaxID=185979 RepID=UPI001BEA6A95|nr:MULTISPECIES: SDR family oxidoreductase [unclassified Bacillus (in: firmicutes)]MBT2617253.1 SDR family oxidoreductase [Bacillus sp. ISL-78]MBT2627812.1 SDR family oxidoreductase [Bacillus sp. ISL-101]